MYQFVKGLRDNHAQERILEASANEEGGELSLEKVIKFAESFEMGKNSQEIVNKGQVSQLSEYQKGKSKSCQDTRAKPNNATKSASDKCGNCGKQGHSSKLNDRRANCPAFDKTCSKCKTNGHFADLCRGGPRESRDKSKSRSTSTVNEVKASETETKDKETEEGQVGMLSSSWFLLNGLQDPTPQGSIYEVSDVFTSRLLSGSTDPWCSPSLAALSTKPSKKCHPPPDKPVTSWVLIWSHTRGRGSSWPLHHSHRVYYPGRPPPKAPADSGSTVPGRNRQDAPHPSEFS